MDRGRYLVELNNAVSLMTQSLQQVELTAPVPTCPGWTITDLVDHLGCVHLWAAQAARTGARPDPYPTRDQRDLSLPEWYAECGIHLLETLDGLDVDQPAWTFSRTDRTVGFWLRRQLHETTIHWTDVLLTAGADVPQAPELTSEVAEDGVDELLLFFLQRSMAKADPQALSQLVPAPVTVACTDRPGAWRVSLEDGALAVVRTDEASADSAAVISAAAIDLYLTLWNRADRGDLSVSGDEAAARAFLAGQLVP